ncbi:hypothetical protein ABMA27_007549 [Loxostege sticticalis]|uniref:Uncharacterized protein n=1 Tax=Loxostege sticticalis TaxID=481309 RepID=A0ABR3HFT4_LOXSC
MGEEKKSLLIRLAPFSRNFLYVFSCLLHKMSNFDPSFFELIPPELSFWRCWSLPQKIIPNTKNKIPRSFVVEGDFLRIVQKYMNQRSQKGKTVIFFQNYQKGKCTAQAIGINKFGNMPKEIATFLGLPDRLSQTVNMQPKTSPVSIKNCSNFNVYVNYNFYKK